MGEGVAVCLLWCVAVAVYRNGNLLDVAMCGSCGGRVTVQVVVVWETCSVRE